MSILPAFMEIKKSQIDFDSLPGSNSLFCHKKTQHTRSRMTQSARLLMPAGFVPSPDDVVIGRGKHIIARNARFLHIIETELETYRNAISKTLKSSILGRVFAFIREVRGGLFVKHDPHSGRWYTVEDTLARTTIAQSFRDALDTTYRSSKRFKRRRRKQRKSLAEIGADDETTSKDHASDEVIANNSQPGDSQAVTLLSAFQCKQKKKTLKPTKSKRIKTKPPKTNLWSHKSDRRKVISSLAASSLGESNEKTTASSDPSFHLKSYLESHFDLSGQESSSMPSLDELVSEHKREDLFSPLLFSVFDDSPLPVPKANKTLPDPPMTMPATHFDDGDVTECFNIGNDDDAPGLLDPVDASDWATFFSV